MNQSLKSDLPESSTSEAMAMTIATARGLIWLLVASSIVPIVLSDSLPLPLPIPFELQRGNQRQYRTSLTYWADQRERQSLPGSVPPGGICSGDPDCNGYPHAYCSGTCMCRAGSFNAGSTCVESGRSLFDMIQFCYQLQVVQDHRQQALVPPITFTSPKLATA